MTTNWLSPPLVPTAAVLSASKDDVLFDVSVRGDGEDTIASMGESSASSRSSSFLFFPVYIEDVKCIEGESEDKGEKSATSERYIPGETALDGEERPPLANKVQRAEREAPVENGGKEGVQPVTHKTTYSEEYDRKVDDGEVHLEATRQHVYEDEAPKGEENSKSYSQLGRMSRKVRFRKAGETRERDSQTVTFKVFPRDFGENVQASGAISAKSRMLRRTLSGEKHYSALYSGEEPREKRLRFAGDFEDETESDDDNEDDSFDHVAPLTSPTLASKPMFVESDGLRRRRDPRKLGLEDVRRKLAVLPSKDETNVVSTGSAGGAAASILADKATEGKASSIPGSRLLRFIPLIPADHPLKIAWDIMTVILTFVSAYHTHTSIRDRRFVMEELDGSVGWYTAVAAAMEYWFLVDVLLNFITEHKTAEGLVIRNHGGVWGRYLTSWFVVDALSLVPWERVYIQPIIERQNRRGFFPKMFFRTRAVVKVTRRLTRRVKWWRPRRVVKGFASFTKLLRNLLGHARRIGISGPRRLLSAVRYIPKYVLFFRNMKGILAVRVLRLVHFCRRLARDCFVKSRGEFNKRRRRLSSRVFYWPSQPSADGDDDTMTTMEDYETDGEEEEVHHAEYEMY